MAIFKIFNSYAKLPECKCQNGILWDVKFLHEWLEQCHTTPPKFTKAFPVDNLLSRLRRHHRRAANMATLLVMRLSSGNSFTTFWWSLASEAAYGF